MKPYGRFLYHKLGTSIIFSFFPLLTYVILLKSMIQFSKTNTFSQLNIYGLIVSLISFIFIITINYGYIKIIFNKKERILF
jgi:hypothetical protein